MSPAASDNYGETFGPAVHAEAVLLSDTVDLVNVSRAIYVGVTGNVKVNMQDGQSVTFTAVPAGSVLPIRVSRVWATGTTATNLVSLA